MLRRLCIAAILLIAFLPVTSSAVVQTFTFNVNQDPSSRNLVHGHGEFQYTFFGTLTGTWLRSNSEFRNVRGTLTSIDDGTVIRINSGNFRDDGLGWLDASIRQNGNSYRGLFRFAADGVFNNEAYDNSVSMQGINLWGAGTLGCTVTASQQACDSRWVGIDLTAQAEVDPEVGPPVGVPEPASLGLMGLGLLGFMFARKRKDYV